MIPAEVGTQGSVFCIQGKHTLIMLIMKVSATSEDNKEVRNRLDTMIIANKLAPDGSVTF